MARTRDAISAEKDYLSAIQHTMSDYAKGQIYLKLGALYGERNKADHRAMDAFAEIFNLKAGLTVLCKAAIARAKLLAAQGQRELAVAEFDRLKNITQQPHWSIARMGLGDVYESLGAKEESLACYKAVVGSPQAPADLVEIAKTKLNATSKP